MTDSFLNGLVQGLCGLLTRSSCAACDQPLPGAQVAGFCPGCKPLLDPVDPGQRPPAAVAALYLYGGPLTVALRRLKYEARTDLVRPLGALLAAASDAYAGRVERVVPVPLHGARLRARGYNQAALLAGPLARRLGVGLDAACLQRIRPTRQQAGLSREDRDRNVRGAFRVRRGRRLGRVLLVDDVCTSGATLAEAAATLRHAGCPVVYCLTLALTPL